MAYTKIINKAYDLADELKETEIYQEMKRLDELIKRKYERELKEYHETFIKFEEVYNVGGIYHPDFKRVSLAYKEKKELLFSKEEVKEYFILEGKMNELLKEISQEITSNASNYQEFKGGICNEIK